MEGVENSTPEGEVFEIEEPQFQCRICEEAIDFRFEDEEEGLDLENVPEDLQDDIPDEMEPDFDESFQETEMRVVCDCGAEYIVKKLPGVPGFEVTHILEDKPELRDEGFEENRYLEFDPSEAGVSL